MSEAFERAREGMARVGDRRMAAFDQMQDQRTNRAAGNALQAGDYSGASNALYQGGNLQAGMAVQNAGSARQTADRETQRSAIAAAVSGLLHVPEAQRGAVLQSRIAPLFQELGLGEYLAQIRPEDLTDQSLRALTVAMGGEVQQPTTYNTRGGVAERDPYTGDYRMGLAVEAPQQAPPAGYRWTEGGGLEVIPGGPADPGVVRARAAAGRAPPRGRSGGGGQPSGGAPRAAPSGGGLPAGFTVRRP